MLTTAPHKEKTATSLNIFVNSYFYLFILKQALLTTFAVEVGTCRDNQTDADDNSEQRGLHTERNMIMHQFLTKLILVLSEINSELR